MEAVTKRLSSATMKKDMYVFEALPGVGDYSPSKEELTVEQLGVKYQTFQEKRKIKAQKEGELKAANDNLIAEERAFHNAMLEVKNQVKSQFGENSNELQSLGLKKKAEYKSPKRKARKESN